MNFLTLLDGPSAVIVLGGTIVATMLRSGMRNSFTTLRCLGYLFQRRFNSERTRSEIAAQIQDIHRDGLYRVEPRQFGDREFDEVADTLIERRSIGALLKKHRAHRALRQERSQRVVGTLSQAAEAAPVFGLCGTLIALSQLDVAAVPPNVIAASLSTAIVTTLYGLLAAHVVFLPLAQLVRRRADFEDAERDKLVTWLAEQLEKQGVRKGRRRGEAA